jgi:hypothetical protein
MNEFVRNIINKYCLPVLFIYIFKKTIMDIVLWKPDKLNLHLCYPIP